MARHVNSDEKQNGNGVGRIGKTHPHPDIDERHRYQNHKTDDEPENLLARPRREVRARHRVKHRKTDARDEPNDQDKRPIDLEQLVGGRKRAPEGGIGTSGHVLALVPAAAARIG